MITHIFDTHTHTHTHTLYRYEREREKHTHIHEKLRKPIQAFRYFSKLF